MTRTTTKQRIIHTAIDLFNEKGYGESSLQDLARVLEMSRGNLTYHYPEKDQLLADIALLFQKDFKTKTSAQKGVPSFANLHKEVNFYFSLQEDYSFLFRDPFVIKNAAVKPIFKEITNKAIKNNEAAIAFAIQLGNLNPEPFPGIYKNLAINTVMLMLSAYPRDILLEDFSIETLERAVWSMLLPHLTPKGINAFKKYFGTDFLENLGEPFDYKIDIF